MSNLVVDATGNDLTYRVIGAAMAVHNALGPGHKEAVYERALGVELDRQALAYVPQYPVEVFHADVAVGLFYLDLFVEAQVVVEIKAFSHNLGDDDLAQVINYLQAVRAPVGLLLNFGRRRLEYRRVFPPPGSGPVQRIGRNLAFHANLTPLLAPGAGARPDGAGDDGEPTGPVPTSHE